MSCELLMMAVAAGDRINWLPYIAAGGAVAVLVVLFLLPKLKKKK